MPGIPLIALHSHLPPRGRAAGWARPAIQGGPGYERTEHILKSGSGEDKHKVLERENALTHVFGAALFLLFAVVRLWVVGVSDFRRLGNVAELLHTASLVVVSLVLVMSAFYHINSDMAADLDTALAGKEGNATQVAANPSSAMARAVDRALWWRIGDYSAVYLGTWSAILASMAVAYHTSKSDLVTNSYIDITAATAVVIIFFMLRNLVSLPEASWQGQFDREWAQKMEPDEIVELHHRDGPTAATRYITLALLGASTMLYTGNLISQSNGEGIGPTTWLAIAEAASLLLMGFARLADIVFPQCYPHTHILWHVVVVVSGVCIASVREWVLSSW